LFAAIRDATSRHERDALLATLEAVGVPAGPINTVAQAFADPQVMHRGMALMLDRAGQTLPGLRTPIIFSESLLALDRAAPMLGRDDPA
jgi:crotonobetainyl-CoA:carnitine CoA-transferase CaiB-like acyl-CoA transferase